MYAEDILILNEANLLEESFRSEDFSFDDDDFTGQALQGANVYTVALPPGFNLVELLNIASI